MHLICTTAARRPRTGTGICGESVVFSPEDVRLYRSTDSGAVETYRVPAWAYLATLPDRMRSESMLDAISGAAVAPSLGRMKRWSFGTTLALANLRLGVWMPNPRWFDAPLRSDGTSSPPPPDGLVPFRNPHTGIGYLLKELAGMWSTDDRRLYLTDGGHWDNLGLVELIRRRCKTIICIDGSGDAPGSFASLRDAVSLAKIQCGAEVTGVPAAIEKPGALSEQTCWILNVDYDGPDGAEKQRGTIIYLLAGIRADSPRHLIAFAAEDDVFPNYSTGNQLLSRRRFDHLFAVGRNLVEDALGHSEAPSPTAAGDARPPSPTTVEARDAIRAGLGLKVEAPPMEGHKPALDVLVHFHTGGWPPTSGGQRTGSSDGNVGAPGP